MIYLDYAADTPVREEVLQTFCEATQRYIANPNANHSLGKVSKETIDTATDHIAELLKVKPKEIIYTSGATESNNLAIKGIAHAYKRYGKHMITTYLEHSSVTGPCMALQQLGYEIDYVDLLPDGRVDTAHLLELLREDTILVSVSYVDSELGIKQDIEVIAKHLEAYPHCFFHVDATQAIGKVPVQLEGVDLVTFAPHKFNGLHGIGVLVKKEHVHLESLIHGGISTTTYRSGTPTLALIKATEKALVLAEEAREKHFKYMQKLQQMIIEHLKAYKDIDLNSTAFSVPYIINLSVRGIKAVDFQKKLEEKGIFISTKSACTTQNTPSRPVYALVKDRKRALSTLRISLSYLVTEEDVQLFLKAFATCYHELKE